MLTTEGATCSTALTIAREYSSKSAASLASVVLSLPERFSDLVSLNKNSGGAARLKFVVVMS